MSETIRPSLRHTPMRDLVRGRVTGRLDIEGPLQRSGLPPATQELIARVVRRTRLWRLEKADVAGELIAHFLDAQEAGQGETESLRAFGDEKLAARLIRLAKKRQRPVAARIAQAGWWGCCGLFVCYIGLGILYYAGSPTIRVNYFEEANARLAAAAPEELAWPLYRDAIRQLSPMPWKTLEVREAVEWSTADPGDRYWPEVAAFLASHPVAMELVRQGAEKQWLGVPLGRGVRDEDRDVLSDAAVAQADTSLPFTTDAPVAQATFAHLVVFRQLARLLRQDVLVAAESRDGERILADWRALSGLARHASQGGMLLDQQVSLSVRALLCESIESVLLEYSDRLTGNQWRGVAHMLARDKIAADLLDYSGERRVFYDFVQRAYTDDGAGDGRITPAGLQLLNRTANDFKPVLGRPEWPDGARLASAALQPASLLVMASRREIVSVYDEVMDQAQADLALPFLERDRDPEARLVAYLETSPAAKARYAVLSILVPAVKATHEGAERYLARRDAVLVGIALELYRREHGSYPTDLAALVPGLLPAIPPDRITGGELRYRLIDGRPVVYSFGVDRDDDGGRRARDARGDEQAGLAAQWEMPVIEGGQNFRLSQPIDGDWVLYPAQP